MASTCRVDGQVEAAADRILRITGSPPRGTAPPTRKKRRDPGAYNRELLASIPFGHLAMPTHLAAVLEQRTKPPSLPPGDTTMDTDLAETLEGHRARTAAVAKLREVRRHLRERHRTDVGLPRDQRADSVPSDGHLDHLDVTVPPSPAAPLPGHLFGPLDEAKKAAGLAKVPSDDTLRQLDLKKGMRVVRNPRHWRYGGQDGEGPGTVLSVDRGWAEVEWDTGHRCKYRWGGDAFDVIPSPDSPPCPIPLAHLVPRAHPTTTPKHIVSREPQPQLAIGVGCGCHEVVIRLDEEQPEWLGKEPLREPSFVQEGVMYRVAQVLKEQSQKA